jgi:hypothetical protein
MEITVALNHQSSKPKAAVLPIPGMEQESIFVNLRTTAVQPFIHISKRIR